MIPIIAIAVVAGLAAWCLHEDETPKTDLAAKPDQAAGGPEADPVRKKPDSPGSGGRFAAGRSGNPGGRPKGAKDKTPRKTRSDKTSAAIPSPAPSTAPEPPHATPAAIPAKS
jgi:hypothetical protein